MSLQGFYDAICQQAKNIENVDEKFSKATTDSDRFEFAFDLTQKFVKHIDVKPACKNWENSSNFRKEGNQLFIKYSYWEALVLFNKSISYAPNDSEELAIAFGNRASCLLRLGYPHEALKDVERGLTFNVPCSYRDKLQLRKKQCLDSIKTSTTSKLLFGDGVLPPLSRGQSTFFDNASKLVELSFDNYCERQLIVNDDVKVGEILVVEKPYSRSLLPDYFHTHCSHCFRRSLNLIPCPECTTTMFCCENCLNSANHSIECQYLGILVKLKVEKVQLLSLKILMDASNQGKNLKNLLKTVTEYENICSNDNNVKYYRSADFINIYNLVTNEGKRSNSDLFYRSVLSSVLILILESKTKFFETIQHSDYYSLRNFAGALLIHFLQVVPCNAHEVSEFSSDGLSEVGAGLYAILSLINHSCDPNVVRHSYRDTIVLRSIKPLKKGEQVLIKLINENLISKN